MGFLWCWLKKVSSNFTWRSGKHLDTMKLQLYVLSTVTLYTANEELFFCTVSVTKKNYIASNNFSKIALKYGSCLKVLTKQAWTMLRDKGWPQWNVKWKCHYYKFQSPVFCLGAAFPCSSELERPTQWSYTWLYLKCH